ncbi:16S rRNA (guanine(527)-N(7))-methyltransferase RsmG [Desertifilum sp. FACHB-1129]|uniref:Ribosomal RNA small subunit methyltransferase G n=1 Tax=Desertifilum tharense IPPAS B-1220 TaxID=1781255 RepID=A0A1E5QM69_9CYAN|nr:MULTISPECIES: 16S rRNA (guanine(527)-N(7))-methyltransferase RsmG [Desertifilum]MDA0210504.1 16S rRNA (guanine(527)-N(7))-methyltransferase RsmG [Cyanobacteria bacterium FC1]MBD2311504.1 16S rRNA (guanine(527)-N(7))-methyltransferase RsmG [Desertifilum sp. FACHB-1129]MBD2323078.1 16S rRNA (guanine(527)-N(7))-methyltransferase RsmG [Desertifilum sp. FACHB-866]MBD2332923.1 16S rRNA (guanine(527)-N(7))-methyltransferase RsmG [Desertifilum sp. FACHB-868]OEJ75779.1 16S rRNA (guanine(527)-N(7))-m
MHDSLMLPEMTQQWQNTLGWEPSAAQQQQFQQLYALILEGNTRLNLTRITQPDEFWEKHLWDSLRGIKGWLQADTLAKAIDIGTGAGFPGIPMALVLPQTQVTLLDSVRKRMAFLTSLLREMGVQNATAVVGRAEAVGQLPQYREKYDVAMIRAVAAAPVCAEYALPLLKVGGKAVLYRGHWTTEEAEGLDLALQQLGGAIESVDAFTTPLTQGVRHCVYLHKEKPTPAEFPRAVGIPASQPLGVSG